MDNKKTAFLGAVVVWNALPAMLSVVAVPAVGFDRIALGFVAVALGSGIVVAGSCREWKDAYMAFAGD